MPSESGFGKIYNAGRFCCMKNGRTSEPCFCVCVFFFFGFPGQSYLKKKKNPVNYCFVSSRVVWDNAIV